MSNLEEVISVNPNSHWYSILNLIEKYPITNNRWQIADGATAFEYFYGLDEQPETDPWSRKIRPWQRKFAWNKKPEKILDWDSFEPFDENKGDYHRMTTIEGKAVSLWMYPSPQHPLYK